jgi:ankyrin repeat protein
MVVYDIGAGLTSVVLAALPRERGESIAQLLVDEGANLNARNNRGWTPLVIAEGIDTSGNYVPSDATAALLLELGTESARYFQGSQTLLSARPLFSERMNPWLPGMRGAGG